MELEKLETLEKVQAKLGNFEKIEESMEKFARLSERLEKSEGTQPNVPGDGQTRRNFIPLVRDGHGNRSYKRKSYGNYNETTNRNWQWTPNMSDNNFQQPPPTPWTYPNSHPADFQRFHQIKRTTVFNPHSASTSMIPPSQYQVVDQTWSSYPVDPNPSANNFRYLPF